MSVTFGIVLLREHEPHFFSCMPQKAASQRADLVSSSATLVSPSDTRRRFQTTHPQHSTLHPGLRPQSEEHSESPFRGSTPQSGFTSRDHAALDEHSFIQNTEQRLDDFLTQGRAVLDNLVDQRNMLKGTQRRLLDSAHTLGLSRDVIGWIERRRYVPSPHTSFVSSKYSPSTQDMYIFVGGAAFTFFCFYLIWSYLG
jgi:Golgi SNAP receptor complex protein 2